MIPGKLVILTYHRVLPERDPLFPCEVDAAGFELHMRTLRRFFNVIPLPEAVALLVVDRLPRRAVAITFDDGYADNESVALPILKRNGLTATFFISTGYLDGGRMWNDTVIEAIRGAGPDYLDLSTIGLGRFEIDTTDRKVQAIDAILAKIKYQAAAERQASVAAIAEAAGVDLPDNLMMSTDQVKNLARHGMEIGAHTMSHPILTSLANEDAETEIVGSKRMLETLLDREIVSFAYPNGRPGRDYSGEHVRMVENAGYEFAVSTAIGSARPSSNRYQLPRFGPWGSYGAEIALRLYLRYFDRHEVVA